MTLVSDNWIWMLGLGVATAGLTLSYAQAINPASDEASFPKPLNEMLVRVFAGGALVMIFVLLVYMRGLIVPVTAAAILGAASWGAQRHLRLNRLYQYQLILAFFAFLLGLASWLTAF